MVIELAAGDLAGFLKGNKGIPYSFAIAVEIVTGAAKGLTYMHSMPTPVVHRDVKSGNIMVMQDGVTGKVGDCGESRRVVSVFVVSVVGEGGRRERETKRSSDSHGNTNPTRQDLDSTMTGVGSPLWTAPEILLGKRYNELVDTYSLGIVLFEIATRALPYRKRIAKYKAEGGKGMDRRLFREIGLGTERPDLEAEQDACEKHGVGLGFKRRRFFFSYSVSLSLCLRVLVITESDPISILVQSSESASPMISRSAQRWEKCCVGWR